MNRNQDTIEYAIRYCMSRHSYAFDDGLMLAEANWDSLSDATKRDVLMGIFNRPVNVKSSRYPRLADAYIAAEIAAPSTRP